MSQKTKGVCRHAQKVESRKKIVSYLGNVKKEQWYKQTHCKGCKKLLKSVLDEDQTDGDK